MAHIKLANGQEVKELRVWNGLQWEPKTGRVHDGTRWVDFIRPGLSFKDDMAIQTGMSRFGAETTLNSEIIAGRVTLSVLNGTGFFVGQEVTLADGLNNENVTITNVSGNSIAVTPTRFPYKKNAVIARTTSEKAAGKIGFIDVPRMTVYEGTNLHRYSGFPYSGDYAYSPTKVNIDDRQCLAWTNTANIIALNTLDKNLVVGEEYTFSFWAKASKNIKNREVYINSSNRSFLLGGDITTVWKRYSFSFLAKSGGATPRVHMYPAVANADGTYETFYLADWKLELGTVATPWTPAPEDSI